jgi:hypothetical protein
MNVTENTATENQNKQAIGVFGNGRYSALMSECFTDAQRLLGIEESQADKLARQIGSDFGAMMRDAKVDAKVSKSVSKDGKVTLSEAAKVKGVTTTNALTALRVMQFQNEAAKYHISPGNTEWALVGEFKEYLDSSVNRRDNPSLKWARVIFVFAFSTSSASASAI